MTRDADENGWVSSAAPWIDRMGDTGDFSRTHVLDAPMLEIACASGARTALDVGCGEGRFSRMLAVHGMQVTGLDPVPAMVAAAAERDPAGNYIEGFAEDLPFADGSFDLVVSYLTLIDIDDVDAGLGEMARVLAPGGTLLIGNLTSFSTSSVMAGRRTCAETGEELRLLGHYQQPGKMWFEWDGLRIQNWHRPLKAYMHPCLRAGLTLTHFDEPVPTTGPQDRVDAYQRNPYLMLMAWQKPVA